MAGEMETSSYLMAAIGLGKSEWPLLLLAFLCLALSSAATLALPRYKGQVIQRVVDKDRHRFEQDIRMFIVLSVVTGLFGAVRNVCFRVVGRRISCNLRNKLFNSIIKQDIAFFDGTSTGQLTARLTNDANAMVAPIRTMLNSLVTNVIYVVGGLVMCFYTSWKLSILAFTSISPIIYLTGMYADWSKTVNKEIWSALGDANAVATEAICNIRTVRAFSTERLESAKYENSVYRALSKGIKDALVGGGTYFITNGLDLGAGALILWYGGRVAMSDPDQLSVGELVTFQLYWNMINNGYKQLNNMVNSFTRAAGAAQRVVSLMENLPDIDTDAGIKIDGFHEGVNMVDVSFHYQMRPDNVVLGGLSLTVKKGQVVALVGPSGGGKSTIVRLLMRFYDPVEGQITIDGIDMREVNVERLHKHVGVVTQETQLFAGTIFDNIAYGIEEPSPIDVHRAAKLANAHGFICKFEDGYATRVGERGVRLSGGQKQRIAIARALVRKPRVLLLDEATSALDAGSESVVQEAIDSMIQVGNMTVIVIAHRLSTIRDANKIVVVKKGQAVERGTHEQLLKLEGAYAKLVNKQLAPSRSSSVTTNDG
mmetsp:Transcript_2144/g.4280  ORF Transcript_2144/g.4280 Transcript_2144/m.4280 type:complete len:596 (-) Transcript_2144:143-1930(-)